MFTKALPRRRVLQSSLMFYATAISASGSLLSTSSLLAAAEHHLEGMDATRVTGTLGESEAIELEAIAARIIPDDDSPGAVQAGALYFIDRVLGSSREEWLPEVREGLASLQLLVSSKYPQSLFSQLSDQQQDELLKEIEGTAFFATMRFLTIAGTFSLPEYGGNRDYTGWNIIGFDHRHTWQPPYGFYDADYLQKGQ